MLSWVRVGTFPRTFKAFWIFSVIKSFSCRYRCYCHQYGQLSPKLSSLSSVSFSGTITDLLMARVGKMMESGRLMRSSGKKQKRGFIKKVNCVLKVSIHLVYCGCSKFKRFSYLILNLIHSASVYLNVYSKWI